MWHMVTSSRLVAPVTRITSLLLLALAPLAPANAPANGTAGDADYESPMLLQAADLLPDYLLVGEVFTVDPEVRSDGETNHYTIRSPLGDTEAAGRDELEQAIQELRALALLRDTPKRTGAVVGVNQGMKRVLTAPYRKVKRVVFHPLYAIEAVPGEIADYAGRVAAVSDLFKYGPRVYLRRSLGIEGARTFLARRLHVDSKTDNTALQDELRRVGWGVWMGGLVPEMGDVYIDLGVDLSTEVGDWGDGNLGRAVAEVRREVFPRTGRRLLRAADVPVELREAFRAHPHFTGPMREDVAEALLALGETEDLPAFIDWALTLDNDWEARKAVRLAQILALHDRDRAAITRLRHRDGVLAFETAGGAFVVPLLQDYLLWTPESDARVRLAAQMHGDAAGTAPEVWSLGDFSPRMRKELAARGFDVQADVDAGYGRFERPRKGLGRLEQRYERAVEAPVKATIAADADSGKSRRLVLPPLGDPSAPVAAAPIQMDDPVRSLQRVPAQRDAGPDPARYPTGTVVQRRLNLDSQLP